MKLIEMIGYANAVLGIAMLAVQTMVPLRIAGIAHNMLSIVVGSLAGLYPYVIQHAVLLPINAYRLYEMRKLIRQVKSASNGDHSMDWIKPFTTQRTVTRGETLFRRGDAANEMFVVVSGLLRLRELNLDVAPGAVVGELGFLSPEGKRTQTLDCVEDSVILAIGYERIEELYFQNPSFGFYFLRLTTARLFDNIGRLEQTIADRDREIARLRAAAHVM
jgi:CRP/FNR family cyclic AMP-dependent transcriptional regulator